MLSVPKFTAKLYCICLDTDVLSSRSSTDLRNILGHSVVKRQSTWFASPVTFSRGTIPFLSKCTSKIRVSVELLTNWSCISLTHIDNHGEDTFYSHLLTLLIQKGPYITANLYCICLSEYITCALQ